MEDYKKQYEIRSYSNEIQIEIDDVYACPGHCPGCVLSSIERKASMPDMREETLLNSINKLIEYVPSLSHIEKINLTYGIGDHFLMSNEYLAKIYHLGADLIEKTNLKNKYNGVFLTASLIGKHELIMEKIKALHQESLIRNVPVYVIAVLDPKHLYHKKFADVYKKNIIEANKILNKVDLSINLSEEAIDNISPQELYDFALINNFDEVTINWVPTQDNIEYVYFNQEKLADWLISFDKLLSKDDLLSTSYRPVIMKTINNLMCKTANEKNNLNDDIKMHLPEITKKSIHIDEKGNVFPKYEAIGDVSHTPRLGIKEWGNVNSEESLKSIIDKGLLETEKFVLKQFYREPCLSCDYNNFCANSGFHVYNYVLNKNLLFKNKVKKTISEENCYHTAKKLFKHYHSEIQKNKY